MLEYDENHEATYSPEDNKIRLTFAYRLDRPAWDHLKGLGFSWTMKQASDMSAVWKPGREDAALELAGYIGDEDTTRDERAADRAERFSDYREKRRLEAHGSADAYDAGPSAHGFQNQQKADRAAAKHDKQASYAVNQWSKAEYWTQRTAGVIANALYLDKPDVRARRIKEIKKDIARQVEAVEYHGADNHYGQYAQRWANHLSMRLVYETAVHFAQVGESFESLDVVKGGTIGSFIIHRVNKSRLSKEVNSIAILGTAYNSDTPALVLVKTAAFKATDYTPPTAESLEKLKAEQITLRGNRAKPVPTINPTPEEAKKLQAIWNEGKEPDNQAEPCECSQARFSDYRKSQMAVIWSLNKYGHVINWRRKNQDDEPVCKVRVRRAPMHAYNRVDSIVVLVDKKGKSFPAFELATAETIDA